MDKSYLVRVEDVDAASPQLWTYIGLACLLVYVIKSLLLGQVFHKAGEKSWKAWVPFLNWWTYFKIAGCRGSIAFVLVAALAVLAVGRWAGASNIQNLLYFAAAATFGVFLVYVVAAALHIQAKLHKPKLFILLLFVNLVAPLWLWILALDRSKWQVKKPRSKKK
jgi:hypothetical protein